MHKLSFAVLLLCTVQSAHVLAQRPTRNAQAPTQTFTQQSVPASAPPTLTRIDPPNWWANMPPAMLLVEGDHLAGAHFRLDPSPGLRSAPGRNASAVRLDHVHISANGHWAELWLAEAPTMPEALTITAETSAGRATLPFAFQARRAASDGFAGFSAQDVLYLIMTDRFADGDLANDGPEAHDAAQSPAAHAERAKPRGWHGGDLRGILNHLDYLQSLGITTVWITPVYANLHEPDSYHGYGATDLYAVDPHFGTLDDLRALAAGLHAHGMKIVLDTVPNHIGPKHPWVDDEPEPDWFHGTAAHHTPAQGEFLPLTDLHAPWRDRQNITEGWFADILPDMNQENPAVARYLIQNAVWWVEQGGLDGLRLDTFPYINRQFWQDFHTTLRTLYPHLTTVGEIFNSDPTVVSSFAGGVTRTGVDTGLFTPFDYPLHFGIRNVFTGKAPMDHLADLLRADALYPHPERLSAFLDNHDVSRFLSESGADRARQKLALAFLLTTRGMPQLYSGDEIAMTGGDDPDNRHDFPGGFPDGSTLDLSSTELSSTEISSTDRSSADLSSTDRAPGSGADAFNPATQTAAQRDMYTYVHDLLLLRKRTAALATGEEQVLYSSPDAIAYVRTAGNQRVLVALHLGSEDVQIHFELADTALQGATNAKKLFGTGSASFTGTAMTVTLPANGLFISSMQ